MQPLNLDLKIEKIFIANFFLVVVVMLFVTNMLFLCCCCCLLLVLLLLLLSSYVFSIICIYDHDDAAANSQSVIHLFIESMCLFSWLTRHILVMPSNQLYFMISIILCSRKKFAKKIKQPVLHKKKLKNTIKYKLEFLLNKLITYIFFYVLFSFFMKPLWKKYVVVLELFYVFISLINCF